MAPLPTAYQKEVYMKYKQVLHPLYVILALQPCQNVQAEDQKPPNADTEARLEQTIVTATRTEKDQDSAPGSVSVVTRRDIAKINAVTFDDALKATPGVFISRGKGMMDQMSSVTLRGLPGQSRTLVMVDGIALNSPYAGSIFSSGISPGSLEQIEVVKGAASSLYGGNAMGGVVNLITRMPVKRELMLQTGYGSAMAGEGMENTRRVAASYGDSFRDRLRVYIHNDYIATDGYRSDLNAQSSKPGVSIGGYSSTVDSSGLSKRYIIGDKGLSGAWQNNFTFKTEFLFTPQTRFRFTLLKSSGGYDYDDPASYLKNGTGTLWSYGTVKEASFLGGYGYKDQYVYALGLDTEIATAKIKLNLGLMDQVDSWGVTADTALATRNSGPGKLSSTPASAWSADLQATVPISTWNLLTAGGSFRSSNSHSREYALSNWKNEESKGGMTYESMGSDRTFALFAQDEIMLHEKLTIYAGVRQDWWETYDGYANSVGSAGYPKHYSSRSADSFSPKGAVVYKPFDGTVLRISGGKSFRGPTAYDLYRTWTTASGITYNSNPNLQPEKNLSWDASISQEFWSGAKLKVTYYENYISDLIYSSLSGTVSNKFNAGSGESKGVEMEAEQRFGKLARLFAGYTYAATKITENSAVPASVGKQMTDVPEHMFSLGADFEYGPFGAYLITRYVGKRFANDTNTDRAVGVPGAYDPYFTGDIKLRYKITSWAEASFSIDNIWNEQYYSYYKAPGRSCYGDLTFKF